MDKEEEIEFMITVVNDDNNSDNNDDNNDDANNDDNYNKDCGINGRNSKNKKKK